MEEEYIEICKLDVSKYASIREIYFNEVDNGFHTP